MDQLIKNQEMVSLRMFRGWFSRVWLGLENTISLSFLGRTGGGGHAMTDRSPTDRFC